MLFSVMAVEPASAQRSIKGSVGGGGGLKSNRGGQVKVNPGSSGSMKVNGGGGRGGKRSWSAFLWPARSCCVLINLVITENPKDISADCQFLLMLLKRFKFYLLFLVSY